MTTPKLSPIRYMQCCCCGTTERGRQWWNRDTGYGVCTVCADEQAEYETPERMRELYGDKGIHYNLKDTP